MPSLGTEGDAFSRSIANALETFRKGVDEELRRKDDVIKQLQAKNEEVQQENASLRADLAATKKEKPAQIDFGTQVPEVLNADNVDEEKAPPIPYKDHAELTRNFNLLSQNIRAYETANRDLSRKARNAKDAAVQWRDYAEKYTRYLRTDSTRGVPPVRPVTPDSDYPPSRPSTTEPERKSRKTFIEKAGRSPLHAVEIANPHQVLKGNLFWPGHSEKSLLEADQVPNGRGTEAGKSSDGPRSEVPSSSQTTESEIGTQFPSDARHDIPSSPPVIVSEKILKRKRGAAALVPFVIGDPREGTPAKPIKIKSEPHSSPPNPTTARKLNRVETLDLDEVDDRIDTPRKRRRMQELQRQATSFKASPLTFLTHQRSTSLPPVVKDESINRTSRPLNGEVENIHPGVNEETTLPPDDRALSEPTAVRVTCLGDACEVTPSRSRPANVLNPISTNRKVLPRTSDIRDKRSRRDENRGAKALDTVAEDGNHPSTIAKSKSPHESFNADDILDHLLEEPAPARKQLRSPAATNRHSIRVPAEISELTSSTHKVDSTRDYSRAAPKLIVSKPGALMSKNPTRKPAESTPRRLMAKPAEPTLARSLWKVEASLTTSSEQSRKIEANEETSSRGRPRLAARPPRSRPPLRSKPVDALNIDDFKLNPKGRGSLDLAYADPVRGREARHHMDGCTDPSCAHCGDQLQALAAELDVTVGSALFASTQDENLTEEEKLLKFYLGDTFDRDMAANIKPETRTKMILQAKTKLLSERYARHRVKPMGRAKSPPGFWDYDMPTTQEFDAHREEAEKRQKELIAERHREAMRPGGRWIFRDE